MNNLVIRNIEAGDYDKNYLFLLKQLTSIDPEKIDSKTFCDFVISLDNMHQIIVIEDVDTHKIIGSGTILIEQKFIHNMGRVSHIEDIVVDEGYRGKNLGKKLIDILVKISSENECYKIILDCSDKNVEFYNKCGFERKGVEMVLYFQSKI